MNFVQNFLIEYFIELNFVPKFLIEFFIELNQMYFELILWYFTLKYPKNTTTCLIMPLNTLQYVIFMIHHNSTNISTSPFIELNNFLNWIFVKNIELDNFLNWIIVKYYWIEYWIESFFGEIQILNWINLGIVHP